MKVTRGYAPQERDSLLGTKFLLAAACLLGLLFYGFRTRTDPTYGVLGVLGIYGGANVGAIFAHRGSLKARKKL